MHPLCYAALLLQLCGQVAGLEAELSRLKESNNHGIPPVSVLLEYLRQATLASCWMHWTKAP
jgi:hypothetical protein